MRSCQGENQEPGIELGKYGFRLLRHKETSISSNTGSKNFSQRTKKQGLNSLLSTGDPGKAHCPSGNGDGVDVNLDDDYGDVGGGVGGGVHPRVLIYADCRAPDGAL